MPGDARTLGLCESNAASVGGFALSANPALLGIENRVQISGYTARLYEQSDLTHVSCEVDLRRVGLMASSFGGPLYRESVVAAGLGYAIDGLAVGFSGRMMNLSIKGYGSSSVLGLDAGAASAVSSSLLLAVSARNVNVPAIGSAGDQLPVDAGCGIAYAPSEGLLLLFSLREGGGISPEISLGVELELNSHLLIRAGSEPRENRFAGGLGIRLSGFSLDYGVTAHEALGLTHGMSVCYTVSGR